MNAFEVVSLALDAALIICNISIIVILLRGKNK
jgi:hypothetical protein